MNPNANDDFATRLLTWFDEYGRHDLPWQQAISPYRVWVSEIMLQQTQVSTVIPYYQRFMQRFSTLQDLAQASQDEVLAHWAGLGYYARGRNLHRAAQQIMQEHNGVFPTRYEQIVALPGIGPSTAGAIMAIALAQRKPILDGNVKRVLCRFFGIDRWPGERVTEQQLWQRAEQLTPQERFADYTQAIMDLGATLCSRRQPECQRCPVQQNCVAYAENRVAELPVKKPKKEKPTRQAWFALGVNAQEQLLLQLRPEQGIWGGLWSLPQFETKQACVNSMLEQGFKEESLIEWEPLKHTFSHYHLHMIPLVWQNQSAKGVERTDVAEMAPNYTTINGLHWVKKQDVLRGELGVPAPVLKLIKKIA